MKVQAVQDFYDRESSGQLRKAGEVMEVDDRRAEALCLRALVVPLPDPEIKEPSKQKTKTEKKK